MGGCREGDRSAPRGDSAVTADRSVAPPELEAIRARFPSLAGPTAFLENAGGSQLPAEVPEAIARYMRESYVQLGAGYRLSREASAVVDRAHDFAGRLVNATNGQVILGPSTTALIRMLAECYADVLKPRREIVIAETGHEANIGPWLRLNRGGAVIRWWRVDPESRDCTTDHLEGLLTERTALVILPHVSNLLGAVANVKEIVRRAHAVGARVVVDGVAYAPHRPVDVFDWDVDWYVYSTYKVYGPHMALLYGRQDAIKELTGPNHFFIPRESVPYKFEPGGVSHEGCAGIVALQPYLNFLGGGGEGCAAPPASSGNGEPHSTAGAGEFVPATRETIVRAFETMAALELPLQERLVSWLLDQPEVDLIGPRSFGRERVPTISFRHARIAPPAITQALDEQDIATRHGHMYAYRLCQALDIPPDPGVVRVSLLHYNSPAEVERLIGALERVFAAG